MSVALSAMMLEALGLSTGRPGRAQGDHEEVDDNSATLEMSIIDVVAIEVPETRRSARRFVRRRVSPDPKPIPVIDPNLVANAPEPTENSPGPLPPRTRRYRPRI